MGDAFKSPSRKKIRLAQVTYSLSSDSDADEDEIMDDIFDHDSQPRDGGCEGDGAKNVVCVYKVYDQPNVLNYLVEILKGVSVYSYLPETVHFVFLNSLHWNIETTLEKIFDDGSLKALYEANRILPHEETSLKKETICGICLTKEDSLVGMECGHLVCKNCWLKYLNVQIFDTGNSVRIECPGPGCHLLLNNRMVEDFLPSNSPLRVKYDHLMANDFVVSHPNLRWCPRPGCAFAIRLIRPANGWTNVTCNCGGTCCFYCGHEAHVPLKCDLLQQWIKKTTDETSEESTNWIRANTKECPKCKTPIEKNGGCNHMVCRNRACSYEFCWICLDCWRSHGDAYNCNRYQGMAEEEKNDLEGAIARLKRFHHYNDRYLNHIQGLRFHKRLTDCVRSKMLTFQMRPINPISLSESQCLLDSLDALAESRGVLKYSYGFAFYLVSSNMSTIFEDNQCDLEKVTESLADYLENVVHLEVDFQKVKSTVLDKSSYLRKRRDVLISHVMEGYDPLTTPFPWTFRDF